MALKPKTKTAPVEDETKEPFPDESEPVEPPKTKARQKSTANAEVNDKQSVTTTGLVVEAVFRRSVSYKYADGTLDNYVAEGKVIGPVEDRENIVFLARLTCAEALGVEVARDKETGELAMGLPTPAQTPSAGAPRGGGGYSKSTSSSGGKKFGGGKGNTGSKSQSENVPNYDDDTAALFWDLLQTTVNEGEVETYFWDNTEGKFPNVKPKNEAWEYLDLKRPADVKPLYIKNAPQEIQDLLAGE